MTCKDIEKLTGMGSRIIHKWARDNGLRRVESINGMLSYDWSEEDLQRFLNRNTQRGTPGIKNAPVNPKQAPLRGLFFLDHTSFFNT